MQQNHFYPLLIYVVNREIINKGGSCKSNSDSGLNIIKKKFFTNICLNSPCD